MVPRFQAATARVRRSFVCGFGTRAADQTDGINATATRCQMCDRQLFSLGENSNPNAWMAEKLWGHSPAGIFGHSHLLGGYAGGQAEYVRVPFADVGPIKVPEGLTDEQVLSLSDILPTGYMNAEMWGIRHGDVIAVWERGRSVGSPSRARACSGPSG
jgi:threonine dehydrogenase-like Zn-dependent dehydrogenase